MKNRVIFHFRVCRQINGKIEVCPRGGITVVYDRLSNTFGGAICDPRQRYDKKEGVKQALKNRVLKDDRRFSYSCVTRDSTYLVLRNAAGMVVDELRAKANERADKKWLSRIHRMTMQYQEATLPGEKMSLEQDWFMRG